MDEWKFVIRGNPIAKKSTKVYKNKYTGQIHGINEQKEEKVGYAYLIKESNPPFFEKEALKVNVTFVMPIPKSFSKKKRALALERKVWPTKRPDNDNMMKFLMDCFNGILFKDDSQAVIQNSAKVYGVVPKTVIKVFCLE